MFFELIPGEEQIQKISVKNDGKSPAKFNVFLQDWYRDSAGKKEYYNPNTQKFSNAGWAKVSPTFFTVLPDATQYLDLNLKRPKDDQKDKVRWSMLFVEPVEELNQGGDSKDLQTKINIRYRIGVLIYQTPPSINKRGLNIESLSLDEETKNIVFLKIRNIEESVLDLRVNYQLLNLKTGEETDLKESKLSILPNSPRIFQLELPKNIGAGEYSLVAVIDYGLDYDLEVAEIDFKIK